MTEAKRRKESKELYHALLNDLLRKDIRASYLAIEIDALGYYLLGLPHTQTSLISQDEFATLILPIQNDP